MELDRRQQALVALGEELARAGYSFVTPTPETHRRVNARAANATARNLADVFGWNRPFAGDLLPPALFALCEQAELLERDGVFWKSRVRWSSCNDRLFVHSGFPTSDTDAVFFGPDSYRFVALLRRSIWKGQRLVDVGCGSGVGGLALADRIDELVLADINDQALQHAAVNAALGHGAAGVSLVISDVLDAVEEPIDTIIANPPYLVDDAGRTYRDGGGALGTDLAVRIAEQAITRISPGGTFVLYTGTPVVAGRSLIADRLQPQLRASGGRWSWEEIDPDVFSEELERSVYGEVDRIAAVGLVYTAP